jgi:sugar lactone lactonase YvrE
MQKMIRPISLLILLALAFTQPGPAVAKAVFPEVIPLFNGFQPEGITAGRGHTAYTGSLNGGAIFEINLRSGEVTMLAEPANRTSVGMSFDQRSGYLFVAGGGFGQAYVFDTQTGELVQTYQLTGSAATFINDAVVTRQAVYFTDSFQQQYYRLPLGKHGALPGLAEVETIPLGGDFVFVPGTFNANGIEATPNGKQLIIVSQGSLYRLEPETGIASLIDLGGDSVSNGDGLVLSGKRLFVVQNFLNRIAVVELDSKLASGEITGHLTSPYFRIPTTAARFGNALYAVNARFDEIPGGAAMPDDTFEAVRVPIR